MKELSLIFTRDYDQWLEETLRNTLVHGAKKIWGKSYSDQIIRFTGRTFEWYRYSEEMTEIREHIVNKKLGDPVFKKSTHDRFIKNVGELRREISKTKKQIKNNLAHLKKIEDLFKKIYPIYPLGIFIPGPWRERFLQVHGSKTEQVLKLLYHSREKSEGVLKLIGNHLRLWLGPRLKAQKYPKEYFRLLTPAEVEQLVNKNRLPTKTILQHRAKGYVYFNNKIVLETNFRKFLKNNKLKIKDEVISKTAKTFSGSIAYPGKAVTGRVQIIMNSYEVSKFQKGSILVTPMTSPEYLPAMRKAKAIITDEGGITCHAAIVSRELKKPCVIGTKIATKIFRDGDMVEVDANKGTVKKI